MSSRNRFYDESTRQDSDRSSSLASRSRSLPSDLRHGPREVNKGGGHRSVETPCFRSLYGNIACGIFYYGLIAGNFLETRSRSKVSRVEAWYTFYRNPLDGPALGGKSSRLSPPSHHLVDPLSSSANLSIGGSHNFHCLFVWHDSFSKWQ